jgi:hypothetical protein
MLRNTSAILPSTANEWQAEAGWARIGSIESYTKDVSAASTLGADQFLSLKVIWKMETDVSSLIAAPWVDRLGTNTSELAGARKELKGRSHWNDYMRAIAHAKQLPSLPVPRELGPFAFVLQNQTIVAGMTEGKEDELKVWGAPTLTSSGSRLGPPMSIGTPRWGPEIASARSYGTPQPKPWSPARMQYSNSAKADARPSKPVSSAEAAYFPSFDYRLSSRTRASVADEHVVKAAAISFLQSLFIHTLQNAFWCSQRKAFRLGLTKFQAYVDGHLQVLNQARSAAILDVTARKRPSAKDGNTFSIEWQESAQMALWITEEPFSFWKTGQDRNTCR